MLRSFFHCLTLLAVCLCLVSTPALCAEEKPVSEPRLSGGEPTARWDLSADSVVSHNDSEILEATGNVFLRRGNEYLKADFARYYSSTKWVYLSGNVSVRMGRDEITASEAEFDLRSRVGWLKNGRVFMAGPHAYIKGDRIEKHWGDVYTFTNAKITTCDGDTPAWSITSEEATVEVDGYAHMRGSTMQIRDVPVLYSPFFLFPTKTNRQSGFLLPSYGRSDRRGFYYNQPFFWAIDESNDMTFNLNFMEKRGVMPGIEYRTRPTSTTSGWIRFDWMHDKVKETNRDSGAYSGDSYVRSNAERYWIRGMYDSKLNDREWRFKADLDYVSDQYFLSEFNRGLSGFERSRSELFDMFSRDLQEKSRHRKSGVLFTRDWERVSLNLSSYYTQNQYLGNGNRLRREDENVQRLPQFDAFLHKGRIFPALPLEADASFQAAYMYRRSGTRGARYMAVPRLTLPLSSRYGSLVASGGISQTLYNTENPGHSASLTQNESGHGPRQEEENRTVPFFNIAATTELARVYDFGNPPLPLTNSTVGEKQWLGMRHSIQPRVEYAYRPQVDQRDNPYYDDEDRLQPKTELVYSITNVFTRKQENVVLVKNEKGEMVPAPRTSYHDLVRLRLQQAYDHREASRNDHRDTYERRPFGDVIADLELNLTNSLSLTTRNNWSPYEKDFTRHQSYVRLSDPDLGSIYAGYDYRPKIDEYSRYRKTDLSYVRVGGNTSVGPFSASADFYYDYKNQENHELDLSLSYNHQCFTVIGTTQVDPREKNYQLSIILTGLGE